MDIKELEEARAAEETPRKVIIDDKSGEPYDPESWIMVKGNDSKSVRDAVRRISRRMIDEGKTSMDSDDALDSRIEKAVAGCTAWGGFEDDGVKLEFSAENLALFFEYGHILAQVETVMREHEVFSEAQSVN